MSSDSRDRDCFSVSASLDRVRRRPFLLRSVAEALDSYLVTPKLTGAFRGGKTA